MPGCRKAVPVPLLLVLLAVGCGEALPTGSGLETDDVALSMHADGATTIFQEFSFTPPNGIPVPAPCLGETFLVTGTITGWARIVITPNGHVTVHEQTDFTGTIATSGGDTWVAAPGAHELFTFAFNIGPDGAAEVTVHEGHSRYVSQGDQPDVRFVHRIHRVWLPSGELQWNRVTFEGLCIGSDA